VKLSNQLSRKDKDPKNGSQGLIHGKTFCSGLEVRSIVMEPLELDAQLANRSDGFAKDVTSRKAPASKEIVETSIDYQTLAQGQIRKSLDVEYMQLEVCS
jgi:hypothetical protein